MPVIVMVLPKVSGKYRSRPLFTADNFIEDVPKEEYVSKKAIFTYSSDRLNRSLVRELELKKIRNLVYGCKEHYINKEIGISLLFLSIGAPITAIAAEILVSLGSRDLLILGAAGGISKKLSIGDIVLCTKAVRDEGTSYHYMKDSIYSYPSRRLTGKLDKEMKDRGIPFIKGSGWTTDGLFRETERELEHYREVGVAAVEMEASALFAVAATRKVKAAAIFTISDLLGADGLDMKEYGKRLDRGYENLALVGKLFARL